MAARKTLGENPLDLIVPKSSGATKSGAKPKRSTAKRAARKTGKRAQPEAEESKKPAKAAKRVALAKSLKKVAQKGSLPVAPRKTAKKKAAPTRTGLKTAPRGEEQPKKTAVVAPKAVAEEGKLQPAAATQPPKGRASGQQLESSDRTRVTAEPGQYLTFFMAGEEYGAGILKVKEIIEFDTLTTVPMTPPWIRGVLNLRGNVVAVIDLAVKFGMPESEISDRTCVVIVEIDLEVEKAVMGMLVDAVSQVVDFSAADILPPPAFGTRVHVDYLQGMGKLEDKFVLLIDTDRMLGTEELMQVEALDTERTDGPESATLASPVGAQEVAEVGDASGAAADPG